MKLEEIRPIAEKYKAILEPYCKRIEIAGSIRRKKPECRDIELVCIRDPMLQEMFFKTVNDWKKIKGSPEGRYTQRLLPEGIKLDLFIAAGDGSNWGNILLIRTGSWKFSRYMMGIRAKEVGFLHRGGYLWLDGDIRVDCYEEEDVFRVLKMDYIEPEGREW